jgi:hypothetical protein
MRIELKEMTIQEAIQVRHSVRQYKDTAIVGGVPAKVIKMIE